LFLVRRCRAQLRVLICLIILVCSFFSFGCVYARSEQYFTREFHWEYGGSTWSLRLLFPRSLHYAYKEIPIQKRIERSVQGYSFFVTTKDSYMQRTAHELRSLSEGKGWGRHGEVGLILAFVQSLPYTSDIITTGYDEYTRFPLETLVDGGGDCEDTSILFITLIRILGYDSVFIEFPDHLAVGVKFGETISGEYYEHGGKRYYYCETTGYGGEIGDIPRELRGIAAYVYPVSGEEYNPHPGRLWYFYVEYTSWGGWLLSAFLAAVVYFQHARGLKTPFL